MVTEKFKTLIEKIVAMGREEGTKHLNNLSAEQSIKPRDLVMLELHVNALWIIEKLDTITKKLELNDEIQENNPA